MTLKKGYGKKTISNNIKELVKEGYSKKQAMAIAFEEARESKKRKIKNL